MYYGILEKELGRFFPENEKKDKSIVPKVIHAVAERLAGKKRLILMPAGGFAAELAQKLVTEGFSIMAFIDNFKDEGIVIQEIAKIHKPEQIKSIEFDAVLIATPSISAQVAMQDQLAEIVPERESDIVLLMDIISSNFNDKINQIVNDINTALASYPTGKRFGIVSTYMTHSYLKRLYYLKKAGYAVCVITGTDRLNNSLSIRDFEKRGFFDSCFILDFFDVMLPRIIPKVNFDLIHAIVSTDSTRCIAQALEASKSKFYTEYWDVKEILFDTEEAFLNTMTLQEYRHEQDAWKTLFTKSDGVIIKDSIDIIEHLSQKYNTRPARWMQYPPYASSAFMEKMQRTRSITSLPDEKLKIVYAGCTVNNSGSHAYYHHKSLLNIAKAFNGQGIRFTIINAMDDGQGDGFEAYVALAKELPLFDYRPAVPIDELPSVLSEFDAGWFGFDFALAKESRFFLKTTFGSKIFSYLEAGLPVFVSKEFEFMTKWVEDLGVGIGIDFPDVFNFHEVVARLDLEKMKITIKTILPILCMESTIDRLLRFYQAAS